MVRAFVVYETRARPRALTSSNCRAVRPRAGRHLPSRQSLRRARRRAARIAYYAEWEFADADAFKAAARTPEFMETGQGRDGDGDQVPRALRGRLE